MFSSKIKVNIFIKVYEKIMYKLLRCMFLKLIFQNTLKKYENQSLTKRSICNKILKLSIKQVIKLFLNTL